MSVNFLTRLSSICLTSFQRSEQKMEQIVRIKSGTTECLTIAQLLKRLQIYFLSILIFDDKLYYVIVLSKRSQHFSDHFIWCFFLFHLYHCMDFGLLMGLNDAEDGPLKKHFQLLIDHTTVD